MWLGLLTRFWKPLAGIIIGALSVWYLHHSGYESGRADEKAIWQPRFDAAERALAAANARTEKTEALSKSISEESQRRIDETLQTLHDRASDSDVRIRGLMRQLAARASCQPVPPVPGTPANTDAATESEQRAEEAGGRISSVGADCESDAARLAELQRWITAQRAIMNPLAADTPASGAKSDR